MLALRASHISFCLLLCRHSCRSRSGCTSCSRFFPSVTRRRCSRSSSVSRAAPLRLAAASSWQKAAPPSAPPAAQPAPSSPLAAWPAPRRSPRRCSRPPLLLPWRHSAAAHAASVTHACDTARTATLHRWRGGGTRRLRGWSRARSPRAPGRSVWRGSLRGGEGRRGEIGQGSQGGWARRTAAMRRPAQWRVSGCHGRTLHLSAVLLPAGLLTNRTAACPTCRALQACSTCASVHPAVAPPPPPVLTGSADPALPRL